MEFKPGILWEYRLFLLQGMANTAWLALAAQALALLLAVPAAVARLRGGAIARRVAGGYVEFVRGTPALTQLFWIFYCIPIFTGLDWSPLWGAVVALGLNVGAYDAEAFRAGIQGVHFGQVQAARALGLSAWSTFWAVVFPQATRAVLPGSPERLHRLAALHVDRVHHRCPRADLCGRQAQHGHVPERGGVLRRRRDVPRAIPDRQRWRASP